MTARADFIFDTRNSMNGQKLADVKKKQYEKKMYGTHAANIYLM